MVTIQDQLIDKLKAGDNEAGEYVYNTYAPELMGVCMRYTGNKADAEDVLQETFIDIFQNIGKLKSSKAFRSWMYRIAVNNSLAFLKKMHSDYNVDDIEETYSETDNSEGKKDIKDRILDSKMSQDDVLAVINDLPTGFRTVFNLYVFEKLKHSEIAKELSISVSTSKSQLLRARQLIQKKLYESLSKNETKDKKERVLFLFPLFMSNDLKYIDDFMFEKLNALKVTPTAEFQNAFNSEMAVNNSAVSGIKAKLGAFATKNVIIASSVVTGAAIAGAVYFTSPQEQKIPVVTADTVNIENVTPLLPVLEASIADSVEVEEEAVLKQEDKTIVFPEKTNKLTEEPKPVKQVFVKKVVKVRHQKVVTDTVFKSDTLHLY